MSDTGYAMEPPTEVPIDENEVELEDDSLYEDHNRSCTWGKFKERVEAAGITDAMEVVYIDWDDGHDVQVYIYKDKSFNVT